MIYYRQKKFLLIVSLGILFMLFMSWVVIECASRYYQISLMKTWCFAFWIVVTVWAIGVNLHRAFAPRKSTLLKDSKSPSRQFTQVSNTRSYSKSRSHSRLPQETS